MHKKALLFFGLVIFSMHVFAQQYGEMIDERDGKSYKIVKIGNQIWMAENLAFRPQSGVFAAYNNDLTNIKTYGYLYDYATACSVCPSGWKLPSNADFLELTNYVGTDFKSKLMKVGTWGADENATNIYGFSGIPAGAKDHAGTFRGIGIGAYFWTSTPSHDVFCFARELGKNAGNWASDQFGTNKNISMSVRCIQDGSSSQIQNNTEEVSDEYQESEYEEPATPSYGSDHPIQVGTTDYVVYQTQTCNEGQDLYYNYTGEYVCEAKKSASTKIKIEIHLNDPMYNEGMITINDLKTKEITPIDVEHIELDEEGNYIFTFSISNQPHMFILMPSKKELVWYSEWGHWMEHYFYK